MYNFRLSIADKFLLFTVILIVFFTLNLSNKFKLLRLPLPDTSKLEKLNRELEKSEKKLRKAINDEKALQYQLKQLTRKERTHRLCTRGGMLESFLQEPERLTDDDVMLLLKLIFHRQDTQELLKKMLEREKPETP